MISLKVKMRILLVSLAVLLLATLFMMSFLADRAVCSGLLLVTPNGGAGRGITPSTAERLRRDEGLMLTYEISRHTMVDAINSTHTATLVGTNSTYLDITGYHLISGGFFTQSAWDGRNRFAALNESAAFTMFGGTSIDGQTINIDGQPWIITGVIDDGQEDSRLFVPSSVSGGYIRSLMVRMGGGIGQDYVVNVLAGFGIRDGDYAFINLSAAAGTIGERFTAAWKVAACLAFILIGIKGLAKLAKAYNILKQETDNYYLGELLIYRRADIAKAGVIVVLLLGGIASTLSLLLRIMATVLRWQDMSLPVWYPGADFAYMLSWLRDIHTASVWVFGTYLLVVFIAAAIHVGTIGRKNCGGNIAQRD